MEDYSLTLFHRPLICIFASNLYYMMHLLWKSRASSVQTHAVLLSVRCMEIKNEKKEKEKIPSEDHQSFIKTDSPNMGIPIVNLK